MHMPAQAHQFRHTEKKTHMHMKTKCALIYTNKLTNHTYRTTSALENNGNVFCLYSFQYFSYSCTYILKLLE